MGVVFCVAGAATAAPTASRLAVRQDPYADPTLVELTQRRLAESRHIAANGFALADEDRDERLSPSEWGDLSWLTYARFDRNGDNALDWTEFQDRNCGGLAAGDDQARWCGNAARREFRGLARGERSVLRSTVVDRAFREFRRNDLDRDGYVTATERRRESGVR